MATVSMYDMGAANRNGLQHSVTIEQRKQFLVEEAARQRDVEFAGGETKYTFLPEQPEVTQAVPQQRGAAWSAVFALSLCVFVLIASEFLPVSLLTPIAADLDITEGEAGRAISVSGIFAVSTSLLITRVTRGIDRKLVLLSMTGLMVLSGAIVALAPSYTALMIGRALLGVTIGGFYSLSTATVMRLVPETSVPKAIAIVSAGSALAATIAAPVGSLLGAFIGWRGAFACIVPLAAVTLCWQSISLPALRSEPSPGTGNVFRLLLRRDVAFGMAAILCLFMGQFALFTYLRPFLEQATRVDVSALSLLLLVMGVTGLIGTLLIGSLLQRSFQRVLVVIPLLMSGIAIALIALGESIAATAVLLGAWGLLGTPAPVGWGTWLSRTLPADAEAGGGLMVATIQLAITLGASAGGIVFDSTGYRATFGLSAVILVLAAVLAFLAGRRRPGVDRGGAPLAP